MPVETLRSGTPSKFPRLYCIMDESIFQSFSKKRLNRWLNLPILSAATFFRRRSFYSFKHEKCLYRSINAYFCFKLNTCRSRSPFKLLFRLFPDFSFDARYNSVRTLILLFCYLAPTFLFCHPDLWIFPMKREKCPKDKKGAAPPRGLKAYFLQTKFILSDNRFSFFEEETTAFRVRFLRKHNAFFRVTAFLFPKKEQLLSESVFPSSGIILFRELRLSLASLSLQ